MTLRLTLAGILEVGYAVITRTWLRSQADGIPLELLTSGFRVVTIVAYWLLFREVIRSRHASPSVRRDLFFVGGVVAILLVPVLVGDWRLSGFPTKIVFGLTSIVVAIREEFLYRGVIQNLLERRSSWLTAIVISNVLFTVYHYGAYGAPPFTLQAMIGYFAVGNALGLIYSGTGSLAIAIAMHTVYDVLGSFTPLIANPWPYEWGTSLKVLGALTLLLWVKRSGSNHGMQSAACGPG